MKHANNQFFLFVWSVLIFSCNNSNYEKKAGQKIIIETLQGTEEYHKTQYFLLTDYKFEPEWINVKPKNSAGKTQWIIYTDDPVRVSCGPIVFRELSPGDSIYFTYNSGKPFFSGKGIEKINLWNQISTIEEKLTPPKVTYFKIGSVNDYLEWDQYATDKAWQMMLLLDSVKNILSETEYKSLKKEILYDSESDRLNAFEDLMNEYLKKKLAGISAQNLNQIWDSTFSKSGITWLKENADCNGWMYNINLYNELEIKRRFNFDFKIDSLKSREMRFYTEYMNARQKFGGQLREKLLAYILVEKIIHKTKTGLLRDAILTDYFDQAKSPEYKDWVKQLAKK